MSTDIRMGTPKPIVTQITWDAPKNIKEMHGLLTKHWEAISDFLVMFTFVPRSTYDAMLEDGEYDLIIKAFGDAWFNAPDNDWYALHSYSIWSMVCDLPDQYYTILRNKGETE